jgi:hypothetical protein
MAHTVGPAGLMAHGGKVKDTIVPNLPYILAFAACSQSIKCLMHMRLVDGLQANARLQFSRLRVWPNPDLLAAGIAMSFQHASHPIVPTFMW